jgi:hypothetical protein
MLVVEEEQGVAWRGAAGAGEDRDDVGVAVGVEVSGEEKFVGDCWDLIGDGEGAVAAAEGGDEIAGGADGEDVGEAVAVEVGGDKAGGKGADLTGETGGADGEIGESLEGSVAVAEDLGYAGCGEEDEVSVAVAAGCLKRLPSMA